MASWPPSLLPIAQGTPGSVADGVSVLFFPLRKFVPIGCTGGRYKISKPIAATAGRRSSAVLKVPEITVPSALTFAPSLRGKNSYQEPTRARSWSARIGKCSVEVTSLRRGFAVKYERISCVEVCEKRFIAESVESPSALIAGESKALADGSWPNFSSNIFFPIAHMSSASISAGILISASWSQVAKG